MAQRCTQQLLLRPSPQAISACEPGTRKRRHSRTYSPRAATISGCLAGPIIWSTDQPVTRHTVSSTSITVARLGNGDGAFRGAIRGAIIASLPCRG